MFLNMLITGTQYLREGKDKVAYEFILEEVGIIIEVNTTASVTSSNKTA